MEELDNSNQYNQNEVFREQNPSFFQTRAFSIILGMLLITVGFIAGFYVRNSYGKHSSEIVYDSIREQVTTTNTVVSTPTLQLQQATPITYNATPTVIPGYMVYEDPKYSFSFQYPQGYSPQDEKYDIKVIDGTSSEAYLKGYTNSETAEGPAMEYTIQDIENSITPGKYIYGSGADVSKQAVFEGETYIVVFMVNLMAFSPEQQAQLDEVFPRMMSSFQFSK